MNDKRSIYLWILGNSKIIGGFDDRLDVLGNYRSSNFDGIHHTLDGCYVFEKDVYRLLRSRAR